MSLLAVAFVLSRVFQKFGSAGFPADATKIFSEFG
jgi:hypothetical protein